MSFTVNRLLYEVRQDSERYRDGWLTHPGFWVVFSYRIRRYRKYGGFFFAFLLPLDVLVGVLKRIFSDTTLPSSVSIGPGLYLPHPGGIIVNHMAEVGSQVAIYHQVTLGEWRGKAPVIRDNCSIFGGAKVVGGVTVNSHCIVGPNVVLNQDVPSYTSVSILDPVYRSRSRSQ